MYCRAVENCPLPLHDEIIEILLKHFHAYKKILLRFYLFKTSAGFTTPTANQHRPRVYTLPLIGPRRCKASQAISDHISALLNKPKETKYMKKKENKNRTTKDVPIIHVKTTN